MKLSKTQRDVLQRMAGGAKLRLTRGRDSHYWMDDEMGKAVRGPTVWALMDKKFIEITCEEWRGQDFAITDAGRGAVA